MRKITSRVLLKSIFVCAIFLSLTASAFAEGKADFNFRGIWLRPSADKTEAVLQLDNIQKAGFNAVYVETFYHGFTLYPNKYVPVRPEMKGTDFLKFYIDECHKRGLEYHAWIEVFYWEVDTEKYPQFPRTPLFEKHPDWASKLRDGRHSGFTENAHIFAEPAHPKVRRFMVSFLKDMIKRYDIDGLNLDYVRYPSGRFDAGYSDYVRKAYKKRSGLDPVDIPFDPENKNWRDWVQYREAQVVRMVEDISRMKRRTRKEVVLTAAVFQQYYDNRYTDNHYQDWKAMLDRNLLDAIIPMAYASSLAGVEKQVTSMLHVMSDNWAALVPALAVQKKTSDDYSGSGHPPMSEQMKVIKKIGLDGFSVFCYDWMMDSEEGLDLLK